MTSKYFKVIDQTRKRAGEEAAEAPVSYRDDPPLLATAAASAGSFSGVSVPTRSSAYHQSAGEATVARRNGSQDQRSRSTSRSRTVCPASPKTAAGSQRRRVPAAS